ncbi:hypothetical protein [uncultured Phascolarctobacterium sp.]|uniref:hypothetical protein n=1 Tax=uncultured Phascolarctobacterium sp. TaxID=512296 RepID=UPI002631DD94|nr:hypothetical protein [uncultured Phascolarctobacterium sp.]
MMTTLTKYMKKTTAIAMAAMVLSLPLASVASAHERHDAPPPRHSDRYDRHDRYDKHDRYDRHDRYDKHDRYDRHDRYDKRHKNDNYVTKKDSNKKATTSFIIGAVLGAVIAKNT